MFSITPAGGQERHFDFLGLRDSQRPFQGALSSVQKGVRLGQFTTCRMEAKVVGNMLPTE